MKLPLATALIAASTFACSAASVTKVSLTIYAEAGWYVVFRSSNQNTLTPGKNIVWWESD